MPDPTPAVVDPTPAVVDPTPAVVDPTPATNGWLPETLRAEKTFAKFKDVEGLANSYMNMEKLQGRSIAMPAEDATPEDWSEFYNKLGRPETPTDYDLKIEPPEGVTYSKDEETVFLEKAHNLGLNKKQAKGMLEFGISQALEDDDQRAAKATEARDAARVVLDKKWGAGADRNLAIAQRAMEEFGTPDFRAFLDDTENNFGNHPAVLEVFANMGQRLMEAGDISSVNVGLTSQGAKDKISAIMGDEKHAYFNPEAPGHSEAIQYVNTLHQQIAAQEVRK